MGKKVLVTKINRMAKKHIFNSVKIFIGPVLVIKIIFYYGADLGKNFFQGCFSFILLMIVGEDNYAPVGRVVFLPIMGFWCLFERYFYDKSTSGKQVEIIHDKKEVSNRY